VPHPKLKDAKFGDDGADADRHHLPHRDLQCRDRDFEQAGVIKVTLGVGEDLSRRIAASYRGGEKPKLRRAAGDKAELCRAATEAEGVSNALILVVGYTDSTGSDEINQTLSEKRASSVINYLQQACHWKPYRMLTPTGMAKADPLASNDTAEGKAQNRRVSVNVLVSKAVDGV